MKRILRYLKGTKDIEIIFKGNSQCVVLGFSDLDFVVKPGVI